MCELKFICIDNKNDIIFMLTTDMNNINFDARK